MGFGHGGKWDCSGFVPLWLDKGTAWGWGTGGSPKRSGAGKGTAWAGLLPHSPWKRGLGMAAGKGPAGRGNVSPQSRHQPRPWDPPDLSNGGLKSWNGVLLPGQEQGWGRGWVAQPRADKGFTPGQELLQWGPFPAPWALGSRGSQQGGWWGLEGIWSRSLGIPAPHRSPLRSHFATLEPGRFVQVLWFGFSALGRFPGTAKPKAKAEQEFGISARAGKSRGLGLFQ